MECNRRFFFSVVLIIIISIIDLVTSSELVRDVSPAVIRFDGIPRRMLPKNILNNEKLDPMDESDVHYTNCSDLQILSEEFQPKYSPESSFVRKCCPLGENFVIHENEQIICAAETFGFNVSILNATFFENCIEDNGIGPSLNFVFGNACADNNNNNNINSKMIVFQKFYGDLLYILQNGSLLAVDENFTEYEVHHDYCLDMDRKDGFLYAIVCKGKSSHHNRVLRAEAYLYSTCLLISVPCLLLTAFFYVKIDELRDFHGKSLAFHCICLSIAYTFLSIVQLQQNISHLITYFIQYFLLSCICWLSVLCFDICFKISNTYLKKCSCTINTEDIYFTYYAMTSFGLPIIPVLLAYSHHTFGIPLYYIKGQHNIDTFTAVHFILPASILLFFCFCFLLIILFIFGTKQPEPLNNDQGIEAICQYEEFFHLKHTAQSVAFLFGVMSICMLIETFTSHIDAELSSDGFTLSPFAFFDVLIALQGVFIFIIFVCLPKPLRIVKRWWIAKGSLDVAALTELELLRRNSVTTLN